MFIARQCGIVRNQQVDNINDIPPNGTVKLFDPEDKKRIVKSIALTGTDLNQMEDSQWEQV